MIKSIAYEERLEKRRIQLTNEFAKMQELMSLLSRQQSFMNQFLDRKE